MASCVSPMYDVMLSYSWAQKAIVHNTCDRLKAKNIKVWIDKEQLTGGDIFEKMAEGVKNSKIIIPFISRGYKSSVNAQRELKTAAVQNKLLIPVRVERPGSDENDSTELLIAGRLYFEFYNDQMVGENFDAFYRAIEQSLRSFRTSCVNSTRVEEDESQPRPSTLSTKEQKIANQSKVVDRNPRDSNGKILEKGDLVEINRSFIKRWAVYDKDGYFFHVTIVRPLPLKTEVRREKLKVVVRGQPFYRNNCYDGQIPKFSADKIIQHASDYVAPGSTKIWDFQLLHRNSKHFACRMRYGEKSPPWTAKDVGYYIAVGFLICLGYILLVFSLGTFGGPMSLILPLLL